MILWDAKTRALVRVLHSDPAIGAAGVDRPLAISPDGRWLAAAFVDAKTCLYEFTGTEVRPRKVLDSPPGCLAFSPDSKSLVYRGDADCHVLDLTTADLNKRSVVTANGPVASAFAFSPDSQIIYRSAGDSISICDRRQPDMAMRTRMTIPNDFIWSMAASPAGGMVATACQSGRGSLWRLSGDKAEEIVLQPSGSLRVSFSADGTLVAIGDTGGGVAIWDVRPEKPKELSRWRAHPAHVYALAFNPVTTTLATAGVDCTIRIWEVETGKEVQPAEGATGTASDVCWTPDSKELLVSYWGASASLWDVPAGKVRHQFPGIPGPVPPHGAVSPDGKWLATTHYNSDQTTFALWNRETGALLRKPATGNPALMPSFSHDNRFVACACGASGAQAWNVDDDRHMFQSPQLHNPTSCDFSPAAHVLAVGAGDTVRLYEVPRGREMQSITAAPGSAGWLRFHPDGKQLAVGAGLFDLAQRPKQRF
jgi:WD40 repeat protein